MQTSDVVLELFRRSAEQHGYIIDSVGADGLVYIKHEGADFKISLDNARKSYETSGDTTKIAELVTSLLSYTDEVPEWEVAKQTLVPILVPASVDFHDAIHKSVTDSTSIVLVQNVPNKIVWVQKDHATSWKQSEEELYQVAYNNLALLLKKSEIKTAVLEGHTYGIVVAEESHFDSSLPLSPEFKSRVQKQFGWPVYAVIPVRDLCFIFSKKEFDFLSQRLSSTVIEEFNTAPYPVTRELLKISDKGIEAVGYYAHRE